MGVARGGGPPLDFETISKKGCFFLFRVVKNKFHDFWPALEKILKKSLIAPPLEKNFPTPMLLCQCIFISSNVHYNRSPYSAMVLFIDCFCLFVESYETTNQ